MAIRVSHTVAVRTSRDTDYKKAMWSPDVALSEVVIDTFEKQANGNLSVAVSSAEQLSFGDVTLVKGMYLETETECLVRLNGSGDSIAMKPSESGKPAKLFLEADINQVEVENPSADTVLNGVYVFWGDPTP
jgi:hypothetical protein